MTELALNIRRVLNPIDPAKFRDPDVTATGKPRAQVGLEQLETLWINTGTLCNITCQNCYIESSPLNDRLVYFPLQDAVDLFDELEKLKLGTSEIGFTGGEPFMNPDIIAMLEAALERGFRVLVLTNAMQPMQLPRIKVSLLRLLDRFGDALVLRVSLDHYSKTLHEAERGAGSWNIALEGLDWLNREGFAIAICGRTCWDESEAESRAGYAQLIEMRDWRVDPENPVQLMLLPEMDARVDVPEITQECWSILGKSSSEVMCANSRMAVRRKGADRPVILPCTLIAYDSRFEMGGSLEEALRADGGMFDDGRVKLNHPHCAKFCVLGGGRCSVNT